MSPIPLSRPSITNEEIQAVEQVLRSGWLVQGPCCRAFEEELAAACGKRHAVVVSSGTAALHLCLLALHGAGSFAKAPTNQGQLRPQLLVPAFTFTATASVARFVSPELPLCLGDVDPETFCLPLPTTQAWTSMGLGPLTVVHQFGYPGPVPSSSPYPVLSDAACAIGATAAFLGTAACLSFHPRKVLTTAEGGAILTDDEGLAKELAALRAHGLVPTQGAEVMALAQAGLNYRMTEMAAAIGRVQLRRLPELLWSHKERAQRYRQRLAEALWMQSDHPDRTWQTVALVLPKGVNRQALRATLAEAGIQTQIASYGLHTLEAFQKTPVFSPDGTLHPQGGSRALPVSETLHTRGLALPLFADLPLSDVDRVCDVLLTNLEGYLTK